MLWMGPWNVKQPWHFHSLTQLTNAITASVGQALIWLSAIREAQIIAVSICMRRVVNIRYEAPGWSNEGEPWVHGKWEDTGHLDMLLWNLVWLIYSFSRIDTLCVKLYSKHFWHFNCNVSQHNKPDFNPQSVYMYMLLLARSEHTRVQIHTWMVKGVFKH